MPVSRNKPPPPPENLPLLTAPPPSLDSVTFGTPTRLLVTPHDLELFQASPTYSLLLHFVTDLNNSVLNRPSSFPAHISPLVASLLDILDKVAALIPEFPPEEAEGSRFGNKSFVSFYDAVWERSAEWHKGILDSLPEGAIPEVTRYFCEAFGNRTRIDYGSGHELNFIAWM